MKLNDCKTNLVTKQHAVVIINRYYHVREKSNSIAKIFYLTVQIIRTLSFNRGDDA